MITGALILLRSVTVSVNGLDKSDPQDQNEDASATRKLGQTRKGIRRGIQKAQCVTRFWCEAALTDGRRWWKTQTHEMIKALS